MCSVYQINPKTNLLHDIYHFSGHSPLKDALTCAKKLMTAHYKTIVVQADDDFNVYIGQPSGKICQASNPEAVLETLANLH